MKKDLSDRSGLCQLCQPHGGGHQKTEGVQDAVVNFMTQKMIVEFAEGQRPQGRYEGGAEKLQKGRGRLRDLSVRSETCRGPPARFMEGSDQHDKEAEEGPLAHHCHSGAGGRGEALFSIGGVAGTVLYLAAYLIIGYDILRKAFRGHHQGSGVRRELPDGGGHRGCHCTGRLREKAATIWRPWP